MLDAEPPGPRLGQRLGPRPRGRAAGHQPRDRPLGTARTSARAPTPRHGPVAPCPSLPSASLLLHETVMTSPLPLSAPADRKRTPLNSSHVAISYAVVRL